MKRRGFTLVELLVVVAIIAVLVAILLPSLARVRTRARAARCLVNVRGMGTALQAYIADWSHFIPCSGQSQIASWTQLLMNGGQAGSGTTIVQTGGYGGIAKLRVCPEAPDALANAGSLSIGTAHAQWTNSTLTGLGVGSSYGINGFLYSVASYDPAAASWTPNTVDFTYLMGIASLTATDYTPYFYHWPLTRNEAHVPAFADADWRHVLPKTEDPVPDNLETPGPPTIGIPEQHHPMQRFCMDRHGMAVNVAFLDGHAETIKLPLLWTLDWSANWKVPTPLPAMPPR